MSKFNLKDFKSYRFLFFVYSSFAFLTYIIVNVEDLENYYLFYRIYSNESNVSIALLIWFFFLALVINLTEAGLTKNKYITKEPYFIGAFIVLLFVAIYVYKEKQERIRQEISNEKEMKKSHLKDVRLFFHKQLKKDLGNPKDLEIIKSYSYYDKDSNTIIELKYNRNDSLNKYYRYEVTKGTKIYELESSFEWDSLMKEITK